MKKLILPSLISIMLLACSGGSSSPNHTTNVSPNTVPTTDTTVITPVVEKKIIDNEDMTAGLKGNDTNQNGIRDDIDRLILKKYSATSELRKATEQKARALQVFMEASTKEQALLAADNNGRAWACVEKQLPYSVAGNQKIVFQMSDEIEALTANTKERLSKYWNSNKLISGAYFKRPKEPVCD